MDKKIVKLILKELAQAPQTVAEKVLNSLQDENEKETARAIFKAVNIKTKE